MLPVFETVSAGAQGAVRFARTYPWLLLIAVLVYVLSAMLPALVLPHIQVSGWLAPHLLTWAVSVPSIILLAPVWTALNRFVILREKGRRYLTFDFRLGRVLLVLLALSIISMLGGAPLAFAFDFNPTLHGRRTLALLILGAAALGKLLFWWLAIRLAIAPAMAAAGTRKRPLDTSFVYTGGAFWRIVGVKLVIYLPLFAMAGMLMLTGRLATPGQDAILPQPVIAVLVTIVTACTELVDTAAMAWAATRLASRKAAAAKAAAAKAKAAA